MVGETRLSRKNPLLALALAAALAATTMLAPAALAEEDFAGTEVTAEAVELAAPEEAELSAAEQGVEATEVDAGGEQSVEGEVEPMAFDAPAGLVPIGRLYNKKTSEHLYTSGANEYNQLPHVSNGDWVQEGVAWYAPTSSKTPVYRLYNKRSGDHHYTTSTTERDALVAKHGWTYETVAFYSDDAKRVPLFRLYNGRLQRGQHHYTASQQERNDLTSKFGWKYESIGFYGVSQVDTERQVFRQLELNTNYSNLDVNCDGINDSFMPQFLQQARTVQLSHNGYARAMYEGRGAIVHYWKYDKTNVFIIVEISRYSSSLLKVLRCGPDKYPNMAQFSEVLSVNLDDRNGVVGVNGKRLTVRVSGYYGDNARNITYELDPTSHTFRRL